MAGSLLPDVASCIEILFVRPADQSRPPATNKVQRRAARHSHSGVNWPRQIPAPGLRLGPQVVGRVALEIERPALANDALVQILAAYIADRQQPAVSIARA